MADWVKIAAKLALVAVVMAAAALLLNGIIMPTVDLAPIKEAVGHGKAIINYYTDGYGGLLLLGLTFLTLRYIALPIFMLASIVWRWIFKVNE